MPRQSKDLLAGEQGFSKDNHSTKTIIQQIIPSVLQFVPVQLSPSSFVLRLLQGLLVPSLGAKLNIRKTMMERDKRALYL